MRLQMKFRPLHDRIAIQPLASEEKTTGGIIIPDSAQEKPIQGKVVAVGNGTRDTNGNIIPFFSFKIKILNVDDILFHPPFFSANQIGLFISIKRLLERGR